MLVALPVAAVAVVAFATPKAESLSNVIESESEALVSKVMPAVKAQAATPASAVAELPVQRAESVAREAEAQPEAGAPEAIVPVPDGEVYDVTEQAPEFPGGQAAFMKWLSDNIKYPAEAAKNGIEGRVIVQFVIGSDGTVSDAVVRRSVDPLLDAEALRVINAMPAWTPGKQDGKPVAVRYTIPVTFRSDKGVAKGKGGVILCAGGYGANKKLLKLLNPDMPADTPITGIKTSTGDGIQMGLDIGAKVVGGDAFISEGALPWKVDYREVISQKTWIAANVVNKGPGLQLNKNGKRFFNEGLGGDYSVSGNAMRINGNYMFSLLDDDEKRDLESGSGAVFGYFAHALPGDKMTGLKELFNGKGRQAEIAFVGNTIEEVAKKAGLDPKVVAETVKRYNQLCAEGVDRDFGKDARYMRPIKKAPFYIVKGQHTICDTTGGLQVNEDAQVLNTNGDPIPGLYASGAMAGGKYGPSYVYNITTGYASATAMMGGTFAVQDIARKTFGREIVYSPDLPKKSKK